MPDVKKQSLEELETDCREQLEHWLARKLELLKEVEECEQQMDVHEQKLRYIKALAGEAPLPVPDVAQTTTDRLRRRKPRRSPVKIATLEALRHRPGEWLTVQQIRDAIGQETGKEVSRQAINVNLERLEATGAVRRAPAPKGAGARFVYCAPAAG